MLKVPSASGLEHGPLDLVQQIANRLRGIAGVGEAAGSTRSADPIQPTYRIPHPIIFSIRAPETEFHLVGLLQPERMELGRLHPPDRPGGSLPQQTVDRCRRQDRRR